MASRLIKDLHPTLQPLCDQFLANCVHAGYRVGISCTYRSDEEQDEDYAKGRTTDGIIITNASAGQSPHNFVLGDGTPAAAAFDFYIYAGSGQTLDWNPLDDVWQAVLKIGTDLGLVSGSTFPRKDYDHLELPNWKDTPTTITT